MHDLMHDLATLVAGSESIILNPNAKVCDKTRHVSFDLINDESWQVPSHFYDALSLRTFLLPGQDRWDIVKALPKFFSKFRRLRVFDLNNTLIEKVPDSIKELKHLRYLDFSESEISVLPNSISRLQNLQVLKLRYCLGLKELPIGITKLLKLKHLDCDGCYSLTHMPRGIGKLTSLQTLSLFVVAENNCYHRKVGGLDELKWLNGLTGLLAIKSSRVLRNPQSESEAANLKEKQHLQSLILLWDESDGDNHSETDDQEVSLESLQPHPNIKELCIQYYGGLKFPAWFSSLTNLVDLSLFYCCNCKHLPQLSLIPSLKYLWICRFPKLEYIDGEDSSFGGARGQRREGRSTFFPSLKRLVLWECPQLMGWWKRDDDDDAVAESSFVLPQFSCLSTLKISGCPLLTWMPLFPSLEETLTLSIVSSKLLQQIMNMNMNMITLTSSPPSLATTTSFPSSSNSIVQPLSKLKCLNLRQIDELQSLPEEWLKNLCSLKDLRIRDCGQLRYLPQSIQCLTTLSIRNCLLLTKKCGNNQGEDWPIIQHIPNIKIDGHKIQWEGRYRLDDGELSEHWSDESLY